MRFSSLVVAGLVGISLVAGQVLAQAGLTITEDGKVGIGTTTPAEELHILGDGSDGSTTPATLKIEATNISGTPGTKKMILLENMGGIRFDMTDNTNGVTWVFQNQTGMFAITKAGTGVREFEIDGDGDLVIQGTLTVQGAGGTTYPDFVFSPQYELMPLDKLDTFIQENGHLPEIPTASETASHGLNMTEMQIKLLQKVEELTLYTLAQEKRIAELERQLQEQRQAGTE